MIKVEMIKVEMIKVEMIKIEMAGGRRLGVQPITTVRLKVRSLDQVFNWCATDVHRIKVEMVK